MSHPCAGVAAACLLLAQAPQGTAPLEQILGRLDRLSELYRDQALEFACDERVTYVDPTNEREVHDFEYIYVYEEARGFLDYRTLPRAGLKKGEPPAAIDLAAYTLPFFVRRAYSWIFIFERGKRSMYHYTLEGDETVRGRRASRVRFEPIPPYQPDLNDWVGTAWVDQDDYQLLRIEAQKTNQRATKLAFERLLSGADPIEDQAGKTYSFSEVVTDFKVQKNGLAFPDAVVMTRTRCAAKPGKSGITSTCWSAYSVTQRYSKYRFFAIRTREEIRDFLSGEPAAAVPPAPP